MKDRNIWSALRFGGVSIANPSPDGRGCREAAGEGDRNEKDSQKFEELPVVPLTRSAGADHPLPSGEGFAQKRLAYC